MGPSSDRLILSTESVRRLWLAAGWLGVVLVVYFSLTPDPPTLDVEQGDKLEHVVAYASLMAWFAQVYFGAARRGVVALALIALGSALELAQGMTDYRTMSFLDAAADSLGVAIGWLAAPPRVPNGFAWLTSMTRG